MSGEVCYERLKAAGMRAREGPFHLRYELSAEGVTLVSFVECGQPPSQQHGGLSRKVSWLEIESSRVDPLFAAEQLITDELRAMQRAGSLADSAREALTREASPDL